jgi:hypothetical protein
LRPLHAAVALCSQASCKELIHDRERRSKALVLVASKRLRSPASDVDCLLPIGGIVLVRQQAERDQALQLIDKHVGGTTLL